MRESVRFVLPFALLCAVPLVWAQGGGRHIVVDSCKAVPASLHQYEYRYSKWYTYVSAGITHGEYFNREVSGGYYRSGIKQDFDEYGRNLDNEGVKWWFSVERLYRAKNLFYGPGVEFGGTNGNTSWGIYGRLRYELPIAPRYGFAAFATAAVGIRHMNGREGDGCKYYLWYSLNNRTINGNVGDDYLHYNYMMNLAKDAKVGFLPLVDIGLGLLNNGQYWTIPPKERNARMAIALSFHIQPMYCLNYSLNLYNLNGEIDNLIDHWTANKHIIADFEQSVSLSIYHGVEITFRF